MISALQPAYTKEIIKGRQSAYNIAMTLKRAIRDSKGTAKLIAPKFIGSSKYNTANNVYSFLRNKMTYKAESKNLQSARSLKRMLYDPKSKIGDCKHYTIFCCSILDSLGIPVKMRLISQNVLDRDPTHIYCVAIINGKEVIVDPCMRSFDNEAIYFYKYNLNI